MARQHYSGPEEAMRMDVERAEEIIQSPEIIRVTYRGVPVHLDRVYRSNSYVAVHFEDGAQVDAPVQELMEG